MKAAIVLLLVLVVLLVVYLLVQGLGDWRTYTLIGGAILVSGYYLVFGRLPWVVRKIFNNPWYPWGTGITTGEDEGYAGLLVMLLVLVVGFVIVSVLILSL